MPTDIFELTPEFLPYLIPRRIAGQTPIKWYGQSPRALKSHPIPIEAAFTLIMLDGSESVADYADWRAQCPGPVTLIAEEGGEIPYAELSYKRLQDRLLEICAKLRQLGTVADVDEAEAVIRSWTLPTERHLSYEIHGHGTIAPNTAALRACGFADMALEPFRQINDGDKPYVDQIVLTTNSIFDEREAHPLSAANQLYPRQPDLNLYLPATFDLRTAVRLRSDLDPALRREIAVAVRMLERQPGYNFQASTEAQSRAMLGATTEDLKKGAAKPGANPIMGMRQREIWLGTEAVACLAASEISAVVRLPNRLNLTRGAVRQFAQHYRADRPQPLKRSEMFRSVQRALAEGFPTGLRELINRSEDGIRIIADAHLEWLDIDGIPMGLRHNVSRIPVTPGNLFIDTLASQPTILANPEGFRDVLVVSGLDAADDIAKQFTIAFDNFGEQWREKLDVKFVRVKSRQEMIEAMNAFDGMLMLFDGHGSHKPDHPGVLWLGDEAVDVWDLRGEITRVPPIVILSACDTHAADRNHATVANGFLALGSRSVLGSVFPLHASHAAVFTARLLYRVSDYIPAAVGMFKRSMTWLEVVSGMLRRQAVTDILRHLLSTGLIRDADWYDLHFKIQMVADSGIENPFSQVRQALLDYGIPQDRLDRETQAAIAASSTISYVHLGRPETIVINTTKNLRDWAEEVSSDEPPATEEAQ